MDAVIFKIGNMKKCKFCFEQHLLAFIDHQNKISYLGFLFSCSRHQ